MPWKSFPFWVIFHVLKMWFRRWSISFVSEWVDRVKLKRRKKDEKRVMTSLKSSTKLQFWHFGNNYFRVLSATDDLKQAPTGTRGTTKKLEFIKFKISQVTTGTSSLEVSITLSLTFREFVPKELIRALKMYFMYNTWHELYSADNDRFWPPMKQF